MHEWFREFFWLFVFILFPAAFVAIVISAVIMPLISSRIPRGFKRTMACLGVSLISLFPSSLIWFIWDSLHYKSANILRSCVESMLCVFLLAFPRHAGSVFFYWVPVLLMTTYNAKIEKPKVMITLLIGIVTILAGGWVVLHVGRSLGSATD